MSPPARTPSAASGDEPARGGSQWGEKEGEAYWSGSRSLFQRWMYSCRLLAFSVSLNNYLLFTLLHPSHLLSLGHMPTTFTGIWSARCFLPRSFQLQQLLNQRAAMIDDNVFCFSSCAITRDIAPSSAMTCGTIGVHRYLIRVSVVEVYVINPMKYKWN